MRLRAPGFRGRLVAAMMATSAVTLLVAGAAVLSPLQRRLRQDQLETLTSDTMAARGSLAGLDAAQLRDRALVARLMRSAGRRTGAHVVLLGPRLQLRASNDPDLGVGNLDAARAARARGRATRHLRQIDGTTLAEVAVPLRIEDTAYVLTAARSLTEADAAARVIRQGLIAGALAGLTAAVLFGIVLSARLVRRLRRLRDVALAVADGRPGAEVPADPRLDEVASLTRAVSTMRERLVAQESARRAFVATASHELRTPLASLGMTLELLEEDLGDEQPDLAAARGEVRSARDQSQRLSGLARDLLDLSRLDSEVALRAEPVELGELCRAVLAEFEPAARGRGVALRWTGPGEGSWARGDPGCVARIVRILVENGLRFAPPGSALEVVVSGVPDQPAFDVVDRGPGVPAGERERIFRRFERGANTGGEGGFGLGLAIARELAQRMGGALTLVDGAVGARFRLTLPAANETST